MINDLKNKNLLIYLEIKDYLLNFENEVINYFYYDKYSDYI